MLVEPELIERARTGEASAFNQLVLAYRKRILGTISRLIGRPEDVEDVAQEVFVRLYYLAGSASEGGGIRTVAVPVDGECFLRLSAPRQAAERIADGGPQRAAGDDGRFACRGAGKTTRSGRKSDVREFMDALFRHVSEEDRLLLTLKEVEGLSLRELERIYGVNENALKVRLFRARQRVLKAYKAAVADGQL